MVYTKDVPHLSYTDSERLRAIVLRVERLTGARAAFNRLNGNLYFYVGSVDRGVLSTPFRRQDGWQWPDERDVAGWVRHILLGQQSAAEKDEWSEKMLKEQKAEHEKQYQLDLEEQRKEVEPIIRKKLREYGGYSHA